LGHLHTPLHAHAKRLALYLCEMMGDDTRPWSTDLVSSCPYRKQKVQLATGENIIVDSRADAHYAAWNSLVRPADKVGRRFKLDDCRVWMRLFFWAAHESGIAAKFPVFFEYLTRWVGHFIPIYERTAQVFTRLESRWATKEERTSHYLGSGGHLMSDVVNVPYDVAISSVPSSERLDRTWPYQEITTIAPKAFP